MEEEVFEFGLAVSSGCIPVALDTGKSESVMADTVF